jgi:hypothetical protein
MGFWDTSLRIFHGLCDHGQQGMRRMAQQTGFSKSSVPRLTQAMARRRVHPESWLWETEDGRRWVTRLVVATRSLCGLTRGVGRDTLSELCARLRLETPVGCSPSAWRGVMQALEKTRVETVQAWEKPATPPGEVRDIMGAVEAPFFAQMLLGFRDLPTGYLLRAEVAAARTSTTWKAVVDERLTARGTPGRSGVSDRATALMQRAAQGLECLSLPDGFHLVPEIVKGSALALGRRVSQAHPARTAAQEALARLQGRPQAAPEAPEAKAVVDTRPAAATRWDAGHPTSRRL